MWKLFFSVVASIFVLDMIWLGFIAKNLYAAELGRFLRQTNGVMTPNWIAAVLVYLAIAAGILCFVLPKANGDYAQALLWGVVFGAVTYGVYDFTNYSVMANWPLKITLIDFVWGMVLCGLGSVIATFLQNRFFS